MSVESGREEAFRTYQKMEEEKNMGNQPQRGGELPPVLNPELAGGLNDLEKKLAAGTMSPQEAETYVSQILDQSRNLRVMLERIDTASLPTPEQVNLGLADEADQEKAAKARQSLIDTATARVVTFYVKEAGKGAYKNLSPEQFVKEVRTRLEETMLKAADSVYGAAAKKDKQRILGKRIKE